MAFARKDIEPLAGRIDREERTPAELMAKVAAQGFFGLFITEEYGGSRADLTSCCLVLDEMAKASPAFAGLVSVDMILCPAVLLAVGSEEQQRRVLPRSASGERLTAYSQTEPSGAGNLEQHQTRLTADGNARRMNGAKPFDEGRRDLYLGSNCKSWLCESAYYRDPRTKLVAEGGTEMHTSIIAKAVLGLV